MGWVGPSWAQVGPSQKFGTQKIPKIEILKIQIRSAQNVGKVWISRKKSFWPYLGPSGPIFCVGRKNAKNAIFFLFSLVGQWALSTLGGAIGMSLGAQMGGLEIILSHVASSCLNMLNMGAY